MAEALMHAALLHLAQDDLAEAYEASQESVKLIQELGPYRGWAGYHHHQRILLSGFG